MKSYSLTNIICTFFGVGNIKFAPGTFGSLAAFPVWFVFDHLLKLSGIEEYFFYIFWLVIITILFIAGINYSNIYTKESGKKDASEIVIDEILGQLIAIFLSYYFVIKVFQSNLVLFFYFISIFILFRFFDILKPSLIGYADKNLKGGYGVMIDDVFAGIVSALIIDLIILIKVL